MPTVQVAWTDTPPTDRRLRVFDLEQPRTEDMPVHPSHRPGYSYVLHRRHEDDYRPDEIGPRTGASGLIVCKEHSGTHIDALCHQADNLTLYGDVKITPQVQTSRGFKQHAVEEIPPIIAPGVLLDMTAHFGVEELPPGYAVSAAELQACCERQGVTIEPGDVVLVYLGNERHWKDPERYLAGPGMAGNASIWLAERKVQAVGADNMAWDVIDLFDEEVGSMLPGHLVLLARSGIYIIENLQLAELAATKHYRFSFICTPLKFVGATGSPVRPVAVVSEPI
jgi:kynurenine formamidase